MPETTENAQDREDAIGFGGNQDGTDPPTVAERLASLERLVVEQGEQIANLMTMIRQVLDAAVRKAEG